MLLKEILESKENIVIDCPTEEEANRVCKVFHEAGLKWHNDKRYDWRSNWLHFNQYSCYNPKGGWCLDVDHANENGDTIIPASDFLAANEQPGKVMYSEEEYKKGCKDAW